MTTSAPAPPTASQPDSLKLRSNNSLPRLPTTHTISRRPILHAPIADIHAGASVPKCVYISRRTPLMAAVKRVKKLLREIERRAGDRARGASAKGGKGGRAKISVASVESINAELRREREVVLVKASGRAMEQARKVGEWFVRKERDVVCEVEVREGQVSVVDDIVKIGAGSRSGSEAEIEEDGVECGDTTMELLGNDEATDTIQVESRGGEDDEGVKNQGEVVLKDDHSSTKKSRKRKRKRRAVYDEDDVPEARLRWIKTVEVAIWLKA